MTDSTRPIDQDRGRDDRDRDDTAATAIGDAGTTTAAITPKQRRHDLVEAEQRRFGGMRFFLAFFGWLTATGMVVLLSAIATGIGALLGVGGTAADSPVSTGITGAVVLGVILLVAYFCGGYVASRMARFNGVKQGVAVWLWAVAIVILATIAGLIAGNSLGVFDQLGGIPRLPVDDQAATAAGIGALVGALVVSLVGAILGGLAGMRFHRKVDRFAIEQ